MLSPPRLFRSAAAALFDAVARRTAPPVVMSVRDAGLTALPAGVLADLHTLVLAAEVDRVPGVIVIAGDAGGGAAIVVADGRTSAREVQVFGVDDRGALAAALTAQGLPPDTTRVSLLDGWPGADGEPVALAYVGRRAAKAALGPLLDRLSPGGAVVVAGSDAGTRRRITDDAATRGLRVEKRPRRLTLVREA